MSATERIRFAGASNFRDIGGLPASGGVVRPGLVFRADGLHALTDVDLDLFRSLGIVTVFDLRGDGERARLPNRVASTPRCVMSPIRAAGVDPFAGAPPANRREGELALRTMYGHLLEHSGSVIGGILTDLTRPTTMPAVIHCHGGKDRTGVVIAVLLEVLGTPRDVVLDDYQLTERFRVPERGAASYADLVARGMPPEAALGVMGAPRWAMAETLEQLDLEFGGAEAYLVERGGVGSGVIASLRRRLIERRDDHG